MESQSLRVATMTDAAAVVLLKPSADRHALSTKDCSVIVG